MDVETIVIGAGQAGLAMSHQLRGRSHVVFERGRVGERWRSERWDSLRLLTPNWLNRLPGAPALPDPDGYLGRGEFTRHLESYGAGAPIRERTTVVSVRRGRRGHRVVTDAGDWHARNVVIATGDCGVPRIPAGHVPPFLHQLHAASYRRPADLPEGGVLIVGAGPSGQQLALELRQAGRDVILAVGRHARMPRRYRGRDIFAWLRATGTLDQHADHVPNLAAARRAPSLPVSGSGPLGLDHLATLGITLTGRLEGFTHSHASFADTLGSDLADADRRMFRALSRIDAHIWLTRVDAPAPTRPPAVAVAAGPRRLDLRGRVSTILWATGYRRAYPWLDEPILDTGGEIAHREGITRVPGLYALGLRFQRTRKSHFIGGVGEDAAFIARAIAGETRVRRAA
ncbi:MAG TPA: NAD(P)-binding domain-containing protein [Solirubrobacter sp.]|nr:NAD(P)-binding domain-containing protein [Solirubrobacter sp.]